MDRYLSANQIVGKYDYCLRTARKLIDEIRLQISLGRYPPESILEGCGVRLSERVLIDYLAYRKRLCDPAACRYVPAYKEVSG